LDQEARVKHSSGCLFDFIRDNLRYITGKKPTKWNSGQIHRMDGNGSAIVIFGVFIHYDFARILTQSIVYSSRKLKRINGVTFSRDRSFYFDREFDAFGSCHSRVSTDVREAELNGAK
jgi:hypothetical protein